MRGSGRMSTAAYSAPSASSAADGARREAAHGLLGRALHEQDHVVVGDRLLGWRRGWGSRDMCGHSALVSRERAWMGPPISAAEDRVDAAVLLDAAQVREVRGDDGGTEVVAAAGEVLTSAREPGMAASMRCLSSSVLGIGDSLAAATLREALDSDRTGGARDMITFTDKGAEKVQEFLADAERRHRDRPACASACAAAAAPASSTRSRSTASATATRSSRTTACGSSSTRPSLPYVRGRGRRLRRGPPGRRLQGREPERHRGLRLRLLVPRRGRGRGLRRLRPPSLRQDPSAAPPGGVRR